MSPIIDARNPSLWKDATPEQIWERYKAGMERKVCDLFRIDRPRPVLAVRPEFEPRRESGHP